MHLGAHRTDWIRRLMGAHAVVALVLAGVLWGMVNYLAQRHSRSFDWSRERLYELSPRTLKALGRDIPDVDIFIIGSRSSAWFPDVSRLLKEYQRACRRLRLEWIDPDLDLARSEELARRYRLDQADAVVLESGGRWRVLSAAEFYGKDVSVGDQPTVFRGEQALTAAIYAITGRVRPVVYFLTGHGERELGNYSRANGLSSLRREMENDSMEVRDLMLGETGLIPDDCAALVVAGPARALAAPEVDLLRRYLLKKGRVLLLLEPGATAGLQPLLREWGVEAGISAYAVDPSRTLSGRELFVTSYGKHPITRGLAGLSSIFYMPCPVRPLEAAAAADRPRVTVLAATTEKGWAETSADQWPLMFDASSDLPGPVPVAVAIERGSVGGLAARIQPARMVVFGDADFVGNAGLAGGNLDFFMGAINWLVDREELSEVPVKPMPQHYFKPSAEQLRVLFSLIVVVVPLITGLVGLVIQVRRRR
jgi:hypothetical protein